MHVVKGVFIILGKVSFVYFIFEKCIFLGLMYFISITSSLSLWSALREMTKNIDKRIFSKNFKVEVIENGGKTYLDLKKIRMY